MTMISREATAAWPRCDARTLGVFLDMRIARRYLVSPSKIGSDRQGNGIVPAPRRSAPRSTGPKHVARAASLVHRAAALRLVRLPVRAWHFVRRISAPGSSRHKRAAEPGMGP